MSGPLGPPRLAIRFTCSLLHNRPTAEWQRHRPTITWRGGGGGGGGEGGKGGGRRRREGRNVEKVCV